MKNNLENFIKTNREDFDKKVPPPIVLDRILDKMKEKTVVKPAGIVIPFRVIRWAAAAVLLIACGIAVWVTQKQPTAPAIVKTMAPVRPEFKIGANNETKRAQTLEIAKNENAERKSVAEVDQDLRQRKHALLAKLRASTMHNEKAVMFAGLNNMESPATRINVASEAYKLKNTGNDIVDALVTTLNNDPNANVRLAALDALARFYQESYVRKKLVASLKKQQDPIVQIALINLLTRMKESGILSELDKIVNDENTQKPVKDCAYSGIIQLRS